MSALKELIDILIAADTDYGDGRTYEDHVDNHQHKLDAETIEKLKHLQSRIAYAHSTINTTRGQDAERILFSVFQCINYAKREGSLPDVFDEQLCEGIATFFKGNHS